MLSKELLRSLLYSMHLCNPFHQAFRFHRGVFSQATLPANTSFIRSVPTLLQSASASSSPQYALNSILPFSASLPFTQPRSSTFVFFRTSKSQSSFHSPHKQINPSAEATVFIRLLRFVSKFFV
jgi:hypothetical protein